MPDSLLRAFSVLITTKDLSEMRLPLDNLLDFGFDLLQFTRLDVSFDLSTKLFYELGDVFRNTLQVHTLCYSDGIAHSDLLLNSRSART